MKNLEANKNYCVFIISYKRPHKVKTLKTLQKSGYSGEWFIIIGKDDPTKEEYLKTFGEKVIIFDKKDYDWVDLGDNFIEDLKTPVFVRNAVYDIAKQLGYKYFIVLDDDYRAFDWKCNSKVQAKNRRVKNLDRIFEAFWKFYKKTNLAILSFAQSGDFIGGSSAFYDFISEWINHRKAMNVFFCSTDRRVEFKGRLNDDTTTYVYWGHRGMLFLTIWLIQLVQGSTQAYEGGLTDNYKKFGTYYKTFLSLMYCPTAVKIADVGWRFRRIHHRIMWENAVPMILRENRQKTGKKTGKNRINS